MPFEDLIAVARGQKEADLLFINGRVVNVLSGEVHGSPVSVYQGRIAGFEVVPAKEVVDLKGAYLAPGLWDAHIHIESTFMLPGEIVRTVLPHGTTGLVTDLHEIANVLGRTGIDWILAITRDLPFHFRFMMPSCVPATHLETAGATLSADDLAAYLSDPRVIGLGEMMNFPGVWFGDPSVHGKLAKFADRPIDGHAPGLRGEGLSGYIAAGISSDHESTGHLEALEKLRKGMQVFIREGTSEHNLSKLIPLVRKENARRFSFCSDDRHPADLIANGHIDHLVRLAIRAGVDPITAWSMGSWNTTHHFHLHDFGAIAPGYWADLVTFSDLHDPHIENTWLAGKKATTDFQVPSPTLPPSTMNVRNLTVERFRIPAMGQNIRVIGVIPCQIVTQGLTLEAIIEEGFAVADPERDILKIATVERHHGTGNIGLGFVKGFGFKSGAIATSVGHDSHNIVVIGASDEEMYLAAKRVVALGGGQVVVQGERVLAELPLPVGGLISPLPAAPISALVDSLNAATRQIGGVLDEPFMTTCFLALPVIPALKLTDLGLVDVGQFAIVPLFT